MGVTINKKEGVDRGRGYGDKVGGIGGGGGGIGGGGAGSGDRGGGESGTIGAGNSFFFIENSEKMAVLGL